MPGKSGHKPEHTGCIGSAPLPRLMAGPQQALQASMMLEQGGHSETPAHHTRRWWVGPQYVFPGSPYFPRMLRRGLFGRAPVSLGQPKFASLSPEPEAVPVRCGGTGSGGWGPLKCARLAIASKFDPETLGIVRSEGKVSIISIN